MAPPTGIGRAVRNSVKQTRNYWCGALPRTEIPVNKASKSNIICKMMVCLIQKK